MFAITNKLPIKCPPKRTLGVRLTVRTACDQFPFPPNFFHLLSPLVGRHFNIPVNILQASVSADLHDQLHGRTSQEFIRTNRSPARMRSNPFILWLNLLDITIAFFIGELNGFVDSANPADLLDILIKFRIRCTGHLSFKTRNKYFMRRGGKRYHYPMISSIADG